jgi:hypothetical protein
MQGAIFTQQPLKSTMGEDILNVKSNHPISATKIGLKEHTQSSD